VKEESRVGREKDYCCERKRDRKKERVVPFIHVAKPEVSFEKNFPLDNSKEKKTFMFDNFEYID
jgi:hypothetical protein